MTLHPAAWIAWLTGVSVFAFVVTNPLYLVLAFAAVIVVHLSFPQDETPVGRAVRLFVTIGIVLLVVRLLFIALVPNPGTTTIFVLPELETPRWLGGLELGGAVSAEVLAVAAIDGFRLIVVLAAFGVFNARADLAGLVRSVPAAFRDVGLVVSIAVAFVPGMMRTMRDVRDAQRLRGQWGLRRLAPSLVVPVLGMSLERALLLAESMDARGYGRGGDTRPPRVFLLSGLVALFVAVAASIAGYTVAGTVLALAGAAGVIWSFRTATTSAGTTRLRIRVVNAFDLVTILASTAACVGALMAGPDASYDPYPAIAAPGFTWLTAAITLLLVMPAVAGAESR